MALGNYFLDQGQAENTLSWERGPSTPEVTANLKHLGLVIGRPARGLGFSQ